MQRQDEHHVCTRFVAIAALILLPATAWPETSACRPTASPEATKQAEQKVVLLNRLTGDSAPAQRVEASTSRSAKRALADARHNAKRATAALEQGCVDTATTLATEGLDLASTAFRAVQNAVGGDDVDYRRAHEGTLSYLDSLLAVPADKRGLGDADLAGIRRQIRRAEELAIEGDASGALRLLAPVTDRLERRLVAIHNDATLYYEKSFAGPAEEYAYLADSCRGYQILLAQNAGARRAPHGAGSKVAAQIEIATRLVTEAADHAQTEDWPTALEKISAARDHYERATRLSGIGY